ncbi:transcriptional regulator [Lactonifactor longoviformis]|uniref:Predicted transcriptional regulator YheO, contains PAS and DNA-binding HTH domains n=1 Tax=Lactonifactor longoviformis DSM 17459 TaxID=1122155 RepID=A0A1M5B1Y1_9CLOT|nr:helix-turn-helix transcriptional regulator [Lactonifactor longoviformis]POP34096.1 transcriptional regulator [Lactonifactor longoviformis]SHF36514.1 Predicted transcriptional regulator YheO, contains PAS and DNA-binding HTH domains [Lactonifactor longoviformis DSM 17459]
MKTIEEALPLLKRIMKLISLTLGEECEVVLHDWSKGYEQSIIAIENGHVTNREVGDCGSNLGLEVMRGTIKDGDRFNYVTKTSLGKTLKSSTTYLCNDEGEPLGALCINIDITNFMNFRKSFEALVGTEVMNQAEVPFDNIEFHAQDVSQLTDYLIAQGLELVNKPVSQMTKDDKLTIIKYLDEKGTFLITKSGDKVCQFLNISKFTLYNYLDTIRGDKEEKKSEKA